MGSPEIVLLDTHTVVWFTAGNERLGKQYSHFSGGPRTPVICECGILLGSGDVMSKATASINVIRDRMERQTLEERFTRTAIDWRNCGIGHTVTRFSCRSSGPVYHGYRGIIGSDSSDGR